MARNQDYRTEARNLVRAEEAQIVALLIGFDLIEKAVQAAGATLEPLRRPKAQEEADRA